MTNIHYGENEFVSKRVIAALNKNYTYFNNPSHLEKDLILNGIEIEKTEILFHSQNSGSINKRNVGTVMLIYLKNQEKQDVIKAISMLRANPYVVYAEPDYFMEMDIIPNDPYYESLWGLKKINAPETWNQFIGSSDVVVGVLDSGVYYNHPDLKNNMWTAPDEQSIHGWDFYDGNNDPVDLIGHGTHVAGTIGAVGNNGIGVAGVSWNIKIASLKIGGNSNGVCVSAAIKAIVYATEKKMPILNNSWGGRFYCESLKAVIEQYDGLFIASAGNTSTDNDKYPHFPASYDCDNIISVAATDKNDNLASFSNYGAVNVDIAAPGTEIYATLLNNGYGYKAGTSMAAPHVAGAAALLKGYRPDLTALEIKDIILSSADKIPALYGKVSTGGRLNINAMFNNIDHLKTSPQKNVSQKTAPSHSNGHIILVVGHRNSGHNLNDVNYLCTGIDDQKNINMAIEALPSGGGKIVVLPGTYHLTGSIHVNKDHVTIYGSDNSTFLENLESINVFFNVTSSYNTISDFNIANTAGSNCPVNCIDISGSNNIITGNLCRNSYCGILISGSNNMVTANSCNNHTYGISIIKNDNTVSGNICNDNYHGIKISDCSSNTVAGNICNNNSCCGIDLQSSNSNKIIGNTCICSSDSSGNYTNAIHLSDKSNNYNVITNNLILKKSYTHRNHISNNTLSDNKYN